MYRWYSFYYNGLRIDLLLIDTKLVTRCSTFVVTVNQGHIEIGFEVGLSFLASGHVPNAVSLDMSRVRRSIIEPFFLLIHGNFVDFIHKPGFLMTCHKRPNKIRWMRQLGGSQIFSLIHGDFHPPIHDWRSHDHISIM